MGKTCGDANLILCQPCSPSSEEGAYPDGDVGGDRRVFAYLRLHGIASKSILFDSGKLAILADL